MIGISGLLMEFQFSLSESNRVNDALRVAFRTTAAFLVSLFWTSAFLFPDHAGNRHLYGPQRDLVSPKIVAGFPGRLCSPRSSLSR